MSFWKWILAVGARARTLAWSISNDHTVHTPNLKLRSSLAKRQKLLALARTPRERARRPVEERRKGTEKRSSKTFIDGADAKEFWAPGRVPAIPKARGQTSCAHCTLHTVLCSRSHRHLANHQRLSTLHRRRGQSSSLPRQLERRSAEITHHTAGHRGRAAGA